MIKDIVSQLTQHKRNVLSQIKSLESEVSKIDDALSSLASITPDGGSGAGMPSPFVKAHKGKRTMSASARAAIGAAQRARWARVHTLKGEASPSDKPAKKRKNKISPEGLAKIKAAQAKRWKAYKKAKSG